MNVPFRAKRCSPSDFCSLNLFFVFGPLYSSDVFVPKVVFFSLFLIHYIAMYLCDPWNRQSRKPKPVAGGERQGIMVP